MMENKWNLIAGDVFISGGDAHFRIIEINAKGPVLDIPRRSPVQWNWTTVNCVMEMPHWELQRIPPAMRYPEGI